MVLLLLKTFSHIRETIVLFQAVKSKIETVCEYDMIGTVRTRLLLSRR